MANSPLQPPTLATFRSWGIQRELVICRHKSSENYFIDNLSGRNFIGKP